MLKCIERSEASKLGGTATTYRASSGNPFGTCPASCPLKPKHYKGTKQLNEPYIEAVLKSVPRHGIAWTYTHFPLATIQPYLSSLPKNETIINLSTDTLQTAIDYHNQKAPTVYITPKFTHKHWRHEGVRFIVCPAYYNKEVTCNNCGDGSPLCARPNRNYVIVFPAHGSAKTYVGSQKKGGCYGSTGNVWIQWKATANSSAKVLFTDDEENYCLPIWTKTLPKGTLLRHHIVGDFG